MVPFFLVGIDSKAKPDGNWFCESSLLGIDSSVGTKWLGVVQRIVEGGTWWEEACWWRGVVV